MDCATLQPRLTSRQAHQRHRSRSAVRGLWPRSLCRYSIRRYHGKLVLLESRRRRGQALSGHAAGPVAPCSLGWRVATLPSTTGQDGARVTLNGSATGGKPDALTFTWTGPFGSLHGSTVNPVIPLGDHIIGLEVTDPYGGYAAANMTVTVQDTTPPVIRAAKASPDVLWPANHKLVDVTVKIEVSDIADANPACSIASIASNQPINANTDPYWILPSRSTKGSGDLLLQLRAERAGVDKTARIYTLQINCADAFGNLATQTVAVTVPFGGQ